MGAKEALVLASLLHLLLGGAFAYAQSFYQTAHIFDSSTPTITWQDLQIPQPILNQSIDALTGKMFPERPAEWNDYLDTHEFEDESEACLRNPKALRLVAFRALPTRPEGAQLRLTFQPSCQENLPTFFADTSVQVIFQGPPKTFNPRLMDLVQKISNLKHGDLGFVHLNRFSSEPGLPHLVTHQDFKNIHQQLQSTLQSNLQLHEVQWMSSMAGQLDWVFGRLIWNEKTNQLEPQELLLDLGPKTPPLSLGFYDFLPLVVREVFTNLTSRLQKQLAKTHVMMDLYESPTAAKKVLNIDLKTSNPWQITHQQVTCIQCHSAQERMERTTEFLKHGGAKEFGYFFRGLGYISDQPYVSLRSVQESKWWSEQIQQFSTTTP